MSKRVATISGYRERELKLNAESDRVLQGIWSYVLKHPRIFQPLVDTHFLRELPPSLFERFLTPYEITGPRLKVYFDTISLTGFRHGIELRQSERAKSGIKQVIKVGKSGHQEGKVLDRMEYSSDLDAPGIKLKPVRDKKVNARLVKLFDDQQLWPLLWLLSQRFRFKYHPDGDPSKAIELALDMSTIGFALNGQQWEAPQLELEILYGAKNKTDAVLMLEFEAARFSRFNLVSEIRSKPALGYDLLGDFLLTKEGAKAVRATKFHKGLHVPDHVIKNNRLFGMPPLATRACAR